MKIIFISSLIVLFISFNFLYAGEERSTYESQEVRLKKGAEKITFSISQKRPILKRRSSETEISIIRLLDLHDVAQIFAQEMNKDSEIINKKNMIKVLLCLKNNAINIYPKNPRIYDDLVQKASNYSLVQSAKSKKELAEGIVSLKIFFTRYYYPRLYDKKSNLECEMKKIEKTSKRNSCINFATLLAGFVATWGVALFGCSYV
jgi:hypothetical protein